MRLPKVTPAVIAVVSISVAACTGSQSSVPKTTSTATTTSTSVAAVTTTTVEPITAVSLGLEGLGFDEFIEESYGVLLRRNPQFLTSLGISEQFGVRNDQLTNMSPEFLAETQEIESLILDLLLTFDRADLDIDDQTSFDVYQWYLGTLVAGHEFAFHDWPVHHFVNSYNYNLLILLQDEHVVANTDDADDYITRLGNIDQQVGQVIDRLEEAVRRGIVPPTVVIDLTLETMREDVGGTPRLDAVTIENLPLHTSFSDRLDATSLSDAEKQGLLDRAAIALEDSFVTGWLELYDYMSSLKQISSDQPGAGRLPNGEAFYSWLLRWHTSTDLTADQIHQLGLESVARIQEEMRVLFDELGYPADLSLPDLAEQAAQEAGFLTDEESILEANNALIAEVEEVARPLFGIWPEADVEVVPVAGGGGFYVPASVDGSRPGKFHAGVSGQVPLFVTPTVNYHEAVPGHHTQIAIAQELDIPSFRRFIQYNAYIEGWALYAERLAGELGLYEDDPYGNLGRLQLELLRAVRLVVDTGLHSMDWSRDMAHAYMDEVIPRWGNEVERYMVLPGQATGYMIGMQEILRLRDEAMTSRGSGFDMAEFHDAALGSGSLPMTILDDVIAGYLKQGS